jgi:uncharacterized membrane protein YdjX (TVP38/TMEM64 family)
MDPYGELFNAVNAVKGVISGSVLFMSIVIPFGILPQFILFVFGFAVFLNATLLYDEDIHVFSTFIGMAVGIMVTIYMTMIHQELMWLFLMFVLTVLVYFFQGVTGAMRRSVQKLPKSVPKRKKKQ